jgi:hypothetical protein
MPEYLLELYVPRDDAELAVEGGRSVREAAQQLSLKGTRVRYRRSMFVPDDEICFVVLDADSIDAVRDAARLAGVTYDRLSPAISHPTQPPDRETT